MSQPNQAVVIARRPNGVPVTEDFALQSVPEPDANAGVLCNVRVLSLDPYLRSKMGGRHMSGPLDIGEAMNSECVLEVAADGHGLRAGQLMRGFAPWQHRVALPAEALTPVQEGIEPASLALGVLGMPGLTAYAGVKRILEPKPGDTLFIAAAAGPVGATVAQLCKAAGARIVGIASSKEKCDWLEREAHFDAAFNYKEQDLRKGLAEHCPDGINLYFDNIGGDVLQAALEQLAIGARVALCGLMEQYNTDTPPPGPNPGLIIKARATVKGLVVYDHEDLREEMQSTLWAMIGSGKLAFREDVTEGLANAPEAFCRLMSGKNFGKTIVRL